jgi:tRNA threonylcarbamoyladenosine modification (KEOPS) complex Cgi121 subunit
MKDLMELNGSFGRKFLSVVGGTLEIREVEGVIKKIGEIDKRSGTVSQVLDASKVAGMEHLVHSAYLALTAQAMGQNFAESPSVELVCWAAAEKQIGRAIERVGIKPGKSRIAVVVIGSSDAAVGGARDSILMELKIKRNDGVLEVNPEKARTLRKTFKISDKELTVANLNGIILEKIAILALEK